MKTNNDKRFDLFMDAWNGLEDNTKIALYNEYAREYLGSDDEFFEFDEEFFNMFFGNDPMEVCRATFFGNINNWSDEWIHLNVYGNLESKETWQVAELAEDYIEDIFEHEEIWEDYITLDDDEEEVEEEDNND